MNALPTHLESLLHPDAYPHPVERVRLIETHVSWVLLAGEYAYKIKRPVRHPFVDMRSEEQRHFFCREEVRLNRRFAPELYRGVVPVVRRDRDGGVRIGGDGEGEVIEHAVRMRQFDTREELDVLLAEGRAESSELAAFGAELARIHERLPPIGPSERYGNFDSVCASLSENVSQVESGARRAGFAIDGIGFGQLLRERRDALRGVIEARHAAGRVRECHGDLHCRNVVRSAGRLVGFDGLEFEPAFRWIDVAEEIAFLFMDLHRRGGAAHATAFINAYLSEGGDYEAARLLRLYGAHRALVRAKVAALEVREAREHARGRELREPDGRDPGEHAGRNPARDAQEHSYTRAAQASHPHVSDLLAYVACARELLAAQRPTLVLMSGLSGSGKTWLAQRLAARIGAIHVRSDVERKRLAGLAAHRSSHSGVGEGLYTAGANDRTYAKLARCASDILRGGFFAVVDATFQRKADRAVLSRLAAELGVRAVLIRCQAPPDVLRSRILARARKADDASEANLAVLERQQASYEAIDASEKLQVIDADTTHETVVDDVERGLK